MNATLERLRELRRKRNAESSSESGRIHFHGYGDKYHSVKDLPGDWHCEFEERAAIREYDGHQAREHAEAEAFCEILERMRAAGLAV